MAPQNGAGPVTDGAVNGARNNFASGTREFSKPVVSLMQDDDRERVLDALRLAYQVTEECLQEIVDDRVELVRLAHLVKRGECSPAWAIGAAVAAGLVAVDDGKAVRS